MSPEKIETVPGTLQPQTSHVESLTDFYTTLDPILATWEILETWKEEEPESERESGHGPKIEIALRYTMMKAKIASFCIGPLLTVVFSDPPWLGGGNRFRALSRS